MKKVCNQRKVKAQARVGIELACLISLQKIQTGWQSHKVQSPSSKLGDREGFLVLGYAYHTPPSATAVPSKS